MTGPHLENYSTNQVKGVRRYLYVWRLPGARMLMIGGIIGRMPVGMVSLALILLVEQKYGSYVPAGIASGLVGVANAVASPVMGRLADKITPPPVLLTTAIAHPLALIMTIIAIEMRAPIAVVCLAAVIVGASMPPLTSALRSIWTELTVPPRNRLRQSALALETVLFEMVFVLGPIFVSATAAVASPAWSLGIAAILAAVGTTLVALGKAAQAWRPHPDRKKVRGLGPIVAPGMPVLLAVAATLAYAFGVMAVALPAFAGEQTDSVHDQEVVTGFLLAVWSFGSLLGGLWFGSRDFPQSLLTQWSIALLGVGVGIGVLMVVPTIMWMMIALFVGACTIAPAMTVENNLVGKVCPPGMLNEAYNWVTTVVFSALALGSAVTGVVIEHWGVTVSFFMASIVTAAGAALAWYPRSSLRRVLTDS